jgi:uncharacterized protein (DUF952 family)
MPIIYHIATAADWKEAQQKGYYEHPTLKAEGFIHCSLEPQVSGVLERYFAGQSNLLKLVIDTDKLTSQYVFDWSQSNADTYPHVYGPINVEAVVETVKID